MRIKNIFFAIAIIATIFISCDKEVKKENKEETNKIENATGVVNSKKLALNISGMTCEVGCARFIQSKLSKQEGVIDAKVVFADSLAQIEYDPAKINKTSLISLVDGLAENMYKSSEIEYTKACCKGKDGKVCDKTKEKSCTDSTKACCKDKDGKVCDKTKEKSCTDSTKACCKDKDGKACDKTKEKSCTADSTEECCKDKDGKACHSGDKTACNDDCKKECCVKA